MLYWPSLNQELQIHVRTCLYFDICRIFNAGKALGQTDRLGVQSFSSMSLAFVRLLVASANMVLGILAISFYSLNVSSMGVTSSATFLQISVLVFIFGVLSFTIACLTTLPTLGGRSAGPHGEAQWYDNYSPQVTTREYVTQRRQTIAEQAWTGLVCPACRRPVSLEDNFCDMCGARFKETSETTGVIQPAPQADV